MENKVPVGFIYYLQNPVTGEIFYVGATETSLKNRLRAHYQHLSEALKGQRKMNRRYEYLSNILPNKAKIGLLEMVIDNNLEEREIFYISKFRELNPNLTNMTNGGAGKCTSLFYTEEEKIKFGHKISKSLKGKKKPKGFAENMSIKRKGLGNPATKEISIGWIVADKKYLFKHGFEINSFLNNKNAYGNIFSFFKNKRKGSPYHLEWEMFSNLDNETQDIVQATYESRKC